MLTRLLAVVMRCHREGVRRYGRWTARRYLILDHVIVPSEKHLQRLPACFASYDRDDRTHLSLKKDAPAMRAVETKSDPAAEVIAPPRLGGLHHRYGWRPAA
jgi:hypothetical protein